MRIVSLPRPDVDLVTGGVTISDTLEFDKRHTLTCLGRQIFTPSGESIIYGASQITLS